MFEEKEEAVQKDRENSKTTSIKINNRNKFKKKFEKIHHFELENETTLANHPSVHISSRNCSNTYTNRNPPKRNIAQNRLKKLLTKLDTEMKLKNKIGTVGISRLLDESVVKVEKSRILSSKHKSLKIPGAQNSAAVRLKKIKKEMQAVVKNIQDSNAILESPFESTLLTSKPHLELSLPTLKPSWKPTFSSLEANSKLVEDKNSFMEIDEDISETDEKVPYQKCMLSKNEEIFSRHGPGLSSSNDMNFKGFTYETNSCHKMKNSSFMQSLNVSNDDSHFDVIPFINEEIYEIRKEPSYMALHKNFLLDIEMEVDTPNGDLLIVIDTNVFLSHLNIVDYLLTNYSIPSLNSCVVVVPWPVIQEIDYAMKKNCERLNNQARYANNFLNDCLKKKNARFFAQSLIDFKDNFKNAVNVDDFILQYCMKFVSLSKKVILLTNDKNLSNKAMINNLAVFSTKDFVNSFGLSKFF